ncbi:PREDICTED: complex III assembly factor LYRM7 [Nicrophorus vespilloides]|uniref:Complex III assembly factor LYRM7 n=1 Tax=Nicrophorus vespilloides TaxID=110193 RepID=A0ABM1M8F6_NICVS|nr:PREDICTED: complex III assembly factor LYRM7 [Nicrophorus vespilloides]
MASTLRKEVLQSFKLLHRARKIVFDGDTNAMKASRDKINDEYKRNMHVKDNHAISELIQYSKAVETELRTSVIQAREVAPGKFEAKITKDTVRLDNVPFNDCANLDKKQEKKKN